MCRGDKNTEWTQSNQNVYLTDTQLLKDMDYNTLLKQYNPIILLYAKDIKSRYEIMVCKSNSTSYSHMYNNNFLNDAATDVMHEYD